MEKLLVLVISNSFLILGIIFLNLYRLIINDLTVLKINCKECTKATIINITQERHKEKDGFFNKITYTYKNTYIFQNTFGKSLEFISNYSYDKITKVCGDQVKIYYNPENITEYYIPYENKAFELIFIITKCLGYICILLWLNLLVKLIFLM